MREGGRVERGKGSGRPNPRYGLERLELGVLKLKTQRSVYRRKSRDPCGHWPRRQQIEANTWTFWLTLFAKFAKWQGSFPTRKYQ